MKNSQIAVLCVTVLLAALIVSGTNVWMMRTLLAGVARHRGARRTMSAPSAPRDDRTVTPKA